MANAHLQQIINKIRHLAPAVPKQLANRFFSDPTLNPAIAKTTFWNYLRAANKSEIHYIYLRYLARKGKSAELDFARVFQMTNANKLSISNPDVLYMQQHAAKHELRETVDIISKLIKSGKPIDRLDFSFCLKQLGTNKEAVSQFASLWSEISSGVHLNVLVATTFIGCYIKIGDTESAQRWLDQLIAAGLQPNYRAFHIMIGGALQRGDEAEARRWVARMEERGLKANIDTYGTFITRLIERGDDERARQIIEEMKQAGFRPNSALLQSMLSTTAGDEARMEYWIEEMRKEGVKPDKGGFAFILNVVATRGDDGPFLRWITEAKKAVVPVNVNKVYSKFIKTKAMQGHTDVVDHWLAQMMAAGEKPAMALYNHLIECAVKRRDTAGVLHWVEALKQMKYVPNEATYNLLIELATKQQDQQEEEFWFNQMSRPNAITFQLLITAAVQRGDEAWAYHWLTRMRKANLQATKQTVTAVTEAYKQGLVTSAFANEVAPLATLD